jgi:glycosyltransferase involved in cell wall biosynthesis
MDDRLSVLITQSRVPSYRKPLFNALARMWRVTVVHSGQPSATSADHYNEILTPPLQLPGARWQPGVVAASTRCDVVIAMFDVRWLSNVVLAWIRPRRTIFWGIGPGSNRAGNMIRIAMARRAAALLVYEDEGAAWLEQHSVEPHKIFVAHNTVYAPPQPSRAPQRGRTNILVLGTLDRRKMIDELFEAVAIVAGGLPPTTTIDVIGDGPDGSRLRETAKRLGLERRVRFHGAMTADDPAFRDVLQRAVVAVSPGQAGLSVLESMAYGVPFVSRADAITGGELANITNDVNGVVYSGGAVELSAVLRRIVLDVAHAERLGTQAWVHYHQHRRIENMVAVFAEAVSSVVSR